LAKKKKKATQNGKTNNTLKNLSLLPIKFLKGTKNWKPYSIGELILPETVNVILRPAAMKEIMKVPVSNNTMKKNHGNI
jgi:hypothetical protein